MFKDSVKMSWQNIIHNKMRSFLTILGVLIGVGAIIALISIVQGVTGNITSQVVDMGANKVSVQIKGTPLKTGMTSYDLSALEELDNIKGISPSVNTVISIVYDDEVMEEITIQGKNEVHFANTSDLLEYGRPINRLDVESKNLVCLVGSKIIETLFPTESPIDKEISINGMKYTIIGVLQNSGGFSAGSTNSSVIIPYTTAMNLLGVGYINSVDLYLEDEKLSDSTTQEIESVLNTAFNYNEDGFSVTNMQSALDVVTEVTGMMGLLLGGIASIALVVGGIGIMNMMLVTVTERTTEIGLRKALGATPKTIQTQFILEALFLSLLGGILGLGIGICIAWIACQIIGVDFILVGYSIPLALGFSACVGLVFGYMPARKASRLNPIDALRSV